MSYLNYTIFYKAKFMISSTCDGADLLWDFVKCVRQWQTEKWNKDGKVVVDDRMAAWSRLKDGNRLFSANGSERPVYIEAEYFSPKNNPAQRFWACKISEKKAKASGYCERDWVTEIGFRQNDPTSAEFSCVISYGDTPEFIGRYEETPDPTLPGLIRILIRSKRLRCYSGVDEVTNWASIPNALFPISTSAPEGKMPTLMKPNFCSTPKSFPGWSAAMRKSFSPTPLPSPKK